MKTDVVPLFVVGDAVVSARPAVDDKGFAVKVGTPGLVARIAPDALDVVWAGGAATRVTTEGLSTIALARGAADEATGEDFDAKLLALSVRPQTAEKYLSAVRPLAGWLWERRCRFSTDDEKDRALARYLASLAVGPEGFVHPSRGKTFMCGFVYLYPELQHRLPRSWRSLLAWERNAVVGEGGPESDELLWCMVERMEKAGDTEEADAVQLALDCYLREQDFLQLRVEDVLVTRAPGCEDEVALLLGRPDRGETTKTGVRQGVRLDWSGTAAMMQRRVAGKGGHEKVFYTTPDKYKVAWRKAAARLNEDSGMKFDVGPPHSVRHSGPSRDAIDNYRSLWQIQRRGRWASERSVMRYAKTWALQVARARVPAALLEKGALLMKRRGTRPTTPRE